MTPSHTTPEAFAATYGWSPRRVRKLARELGACRIVGKRMILTKEDVIEILGTEKAETVLLTSGLFRPVLSSAREPRRTIHRAKPGYIYVVECGEHVKIGYSTDPRGRISNLRVSTPLDLIVLSTVEGTIEDERSLHQRFHKYRAKGEWFKREGELAEWIEEECRQ